MTFEEWRDEARTQEPYLNRGISNLDIWEAATKAEREACASVCEAQTEGFAATSTWDEAALSCARAIRAL